MQKHLTTVALVAAGVMVAGWIMNQFYDVDIVKQASDGFDK
ncbi:MAG: hypothetical protein ACFB13_21235 [Kiloniellaceae bacterium]